MALTVISVGGSIIAPDNIDTSFLKSFYEMARQHIEQNEDNRLILVAGGGAPARKYQSALREVNPSASPALQDWLGIRATHLNAMLLKAVFGDYDNDELVLNPTADDVAFTGKVLVAGGWKPGFSTDTDAVYLAKRFGARTIINLSNIKKVYTADPRKDPDAKPLDSISWKDFRKMVGDEWNPGLNAPFDPIASKIAEEEGMRVICADGRNTENIRKILEGLPFEGTVIGA